MLFLCLRTQGAEITRRNWILEQIATPVIQTEVEQPRSTFRFGGHATNFGDTASGQGVIVADLGPLELAAYGSLRVYGKLSDDGRTFEQQNSKDSKTYALELARSFLSEKGHFGRLGVQYIRFPDAQASFVRIGVNLGIYETPKSPWVLTVNTHLFQRASNGENSVFSTRIELGQLVSEFQSTRWRLGGLFGWTYRTRDEVEPGNAPEFFPFQNEHMLFTFGPWAEYLTPHFAAKLVIPIRLWLDKETYRKDLSDGTKSKIIHYPTTIDIPALSLSASVFF